MLDFGLDWSDFSGDSATLDVALLLSVRSQSLLLAAIQHLQHRYNWFEVDDNDYDSIQAAIADCINEILTEVVIVTDGTPVGVISAFVGTSPDIPEKWLACLGGIVSSEDYPELYAIIPTEYRNGDGTFDLPNLGARFIYGAAIDSQVTDNGGEANVTLTIAQIPAHTHTIAKGQAVASQNARANQSNNTALGDQLTGSSGGGESHNNMPPYLRHYWIIKALP